MLRSRTLHFAASASRTQAGWGLRVRKVMQASRAVRILQDTHLSIPQIRLQAARAAAARLRACAMNGARCRLLSRSQQRSGLCLTTASLRILDNMRWASAMMRMRYSPERAWEQATSRLLPMNLQTMQVGPFWPEESGAMRTIRATRA